MKITVVCDVKGCTWYGAHREVILQQVGEGLYVMPILRCGCTGNREPRIIKVELEHPSTLPGETVGEQFRQWAGA